MMDPFEKLYKKHCHDLVRFAYYYTRDVKLAEDIVQDVFLKVWKDYSKFSAIKHQKAFLYKMTKNAVLLSLRKKKVRQNYIEQQTNQESPLPEDELINNEFERAYKNVIFKLPEQCRIIFCMSRFDELSYKDIAKIQGISIKTVETQIGRALVFLRKKLSSFLTSIFLSPHFFKCENNCQGSLILRHYMSVVTTTHLL